MTSGVLQRKALVARLREAYPTPFEVDLAFGPCRITVAVNEQRMARALSDYFKPFAAAAGDSDIYITAHHAPEPDLPVSFIVKPPDPGKTKIKEAYADIPGGRIVRKQITGMVFIFGGQENLAIGPCLENMNQVINFVNNRFIEWRLCRGGLLGHAAGIMVDGRGMALAGFSGAGKSTLSLHIMSQGATFISNDRLIISSSDNGVQMYGVAKMPRINPGTALNNPDLKTVIPPDERQRLSDMESDDLWDLEQKYDAMIDDCFGSGRFVLQAPMAGLVILNWKRGETGFFVRRVDLSQRRDLLPAFMKPVGLFFSSHKDCVMPEPTEDNYIQLLAKTRVWEFGGGVDFDAAAKQCMMLCRSNGESIGS